MDRQWGAEQLQNFVKAIDHLTKAEIPGRRETGLFEKVNALDNELRTLEPAIQLIIDAVDPDLRNYTSPDDVEKEEWLIRWRPAKYAALRALSLLTTGVEVKQRMRPDAPELAADRLHPWVWDAARPMWEAGSPQAAVLAATQSVNARVQQKLKRYDVSEKQLCEEAFSLNDPKPGRPRLRFPGDRNTPTWRSLQDGARSFGAGCFMAIRNPVGHNYEHPIEVQEALEQLAALSVLARWIESCAVDDEEETTDGL